MLLTDFRKALADHDVRALEPHNGPYHFARQNERIGSLIAQIDPLLIKAGLLAKGEAIGNDRRLRLLEKLHAFT